MAKQTAAPALVETQPRTAVNVWFQIIFATVNTPQTFPAYQVPAGLTVKLGGSNGQQANNSTVYVGRYPEQLRSGQGVAIVPPSILPSDYLEIAVDNLSQIWAMGADNGDGLIAIIQGTAIG